ncbi:MAG: hypothetical protein OEY36_09380 [Gammaproteobacteria bacterium]|nr:hypothetical protein [Gammaproteobacteria bacterium]
MHRLQKKVSRIVLCFFVLSSLGLAVQTSAHAFMMQEMQQHKAMGHDMSAHCKPVLCESVIALDNQSNAGAEAVSLINLSLIPANVVLSVSVPAVIAISRISYYSGLIDYGPSISEQTGLLRI